MLRNTSNRGNTDKLKHEWGGEARGADTAWTNDVKQMKRLKALTMTGQIIRRRFLTEKLPGAISGSRISRSCVKGKTAPKCQISDDFPNFLICCYNNT